MFLNATLILFDVNPVPGGVQGFQLKCDVSNKNISVFTLWPFHLRSEIEKQAVNS